MAVLLECEFDVEVECSAYIASEIVKVSRKYQPNIIIIDTLLAGSSDIKMILYIRDRLPNASIMLLLRADDDFIHSFETGARVSEDTSLKDCIRAIALTDEQAVCTSPPMTLILPAEPSFLRIDKGRAKLRDISALTEREKEVIQLVAQGLTNKDIASSLLISEGTVKVHLRNIMEKLQARTRQHAVAIVAASLLS